MGLRPSCSRITNDYTHAREVGSEAAREVDNQAAREVGRTAAAFEVGRTATVREVGWTATALKVGRITVLDVGRTVVTAPSDHQ